MAVRGTVVMSGARRRGLALVFAALALLLDYLFLLAPILQARRHEELVKYSFRNATLAAFFSILGLGIVVPAFVQLSPAFHAFGRALSNPETKRMSPRGWALFGVVVALSAAVAYAVELQVRGYGYDV